jgi:hypothetical protein
VPWELLRHSIVQRRDGRTVIHSSVPNGHLPDTNERMKVSVNQANQERSETPKACPGNLHESGKELQETTNSAKTMTALLSTDVQTYTEWTFIPKRNGKGGTKQISNGLKEQKIRPKEPKVGPKESHQKQAKNEIGSQLI